MATHNVAILDDGAEMPFDLSWACPSIALLMWWWTAEWQRMAGFRSSSGPWNQISGSTRWVTAPIPARQRRVCSPRCCQSGRKRLDRQAGNRGKATEYNGFGTCYIEFGGGRIGKVEADFFSGPTPTGTLYQPRSACGRTRSILVPAARPWFGLRTDKIGFGSSSVSPAGRSVTMDLMSGIR